MASTDDIVSSLPKIEGGRYEALSPAFKGVRVSDLADLDREDFEKMVSVLSAEHVPLARVFLKRVILPAKEKISRQGLDNEITLQGSNGAEFDATLSPYDWDASIGVLSFSSRVISSLFSSRSVSQLPCDRLPEFISRLPFKSEILILDLSRCNLLDIDCQYVRAACEMLPVCVTLDLSFNRLHGLSPPDRQRLDTFLQTVLSKGTVFVDIVGNAAATIDRIDLFADVLSPAHLARLIWLSASVSQKRAAFESFFVSRRDSQEAVDAVMQAHAQYYGTVYINQKTKCIHGTSTHELFGGGTPRLVVSVDDAVNLVATQGYRLCRHSHCTLRFAQKLRDCNADS